MAEIAATLPHNADAERAILGAILLYPNSALDVFPNLRVADFFLPQHQIIYRHIQAIAARGCPIDIVPLIESINSTSGEMERAGGPGYISSLPDDPLPRASNIGHYVKIVSDKSRRRSIIHIAENLQQRAFDGADESEYVAEQGIADLLNATTDRAETVRARPFEVVAKSVMDNFVSAKLDPKQVARMNFGLSDLDDVTAGLRRTELVVIVAPTSNGKTLLASQLAAQASADGFRTLFFSAEMPAEQIVQRELSFRAGVQFYKTQRPELLSIPELAQLQTASHHALNISIVDRDITPTRIWAMSEAAKRTQGVDLVIVDYDQLVIEAGIDPNSDDDNVFRHQRAFIIAAQKLARRLDICVVILSQLRKIPAKVENGLNPRLDDIWGDSSVRNTPQVILWIVRHYFAHGMAPEYERKATVHILKSRNGSTGHVDLDFDPDYLRFQNELAIEQVRVP
jgi:replicative DNA helicase